jgi:hypothetical protein
MLLASTRTCAFYVKRRPFFTGLAKNMAHFSGSLAVPRKSAFHWLDLTIAFVFRTMTLLRSLENPHPIGDDLPRHCEAPPFFQKSPYANFKGLRCLRGVGVGRFWAGGPFWAEGPSLGGPDHLSQVEVWLLFSVVFLCGNYHRPFVRLVWMKLTVRCILLSITIYIYFFLRKDALQRNEIIFIF